jgi:hypothetical protein
LPELIPNPGIVAGAVNNATTALTKGPSPTIQKFVFMLIISSIQRLPFQKGLKFFLPAILPRLVRGQDHATHETLELAERESPFGWRRPLIDMPVSR